MYVGGQFLSPHCFFMVEQWLMWHKMLPSRSSLLVEITLKVVGLTALCIYAHGA